MNTKKTSSISESKEEKELHSLMCASQSGDSASYRILLHKVKRILDAFIKNSLVKTNSAALGGADDICQEILMAIHAKRHTFDSEQYFLPWLYAIARFKIIDHWRLAKKHSFHGELEEESFVSAVNHESTSSAELDITEVLSGLPKKQKDIVEMVKLQGLSIAEASSQTGFTESDIKVTIHRALKALRKKMGGQ